MLDGDRLDPSGERIARLGQVGERSVWAGAQREREARAAARQVDEQRPRAGRQRERHRARPHAAASAGHGACTVPTAPRIGPAVWLSRARAASSMPDTSAAVSRELDHGTNAGPERGTIRLDVGVLRQEHDRRVRTRAHRLVAQPAAGAPGASATRRTSHAGAPYRRARGFARRPPPHRSVRAAVDRRRARGHDRGVGRDDHTTHSGDGHPTPCPTRTTSRSEPRPSAAMSVPTAAGGRRSVATAAPSERPAATTRTFESTIVGSDAAPGGRKHHVGMRPGEVVRPEARLRRPPAQRRHAPERGARRRRVRPPSAACRLGARPRAAARAPCRGSAIAPLEA